MSLEFTGERFVPGVANNLAAEHIARYHFSLPFAKDKTVLDLGCGTGYGTFLLSRLAKQVVGFDIDMQTVKYASAHYRCQNVLFSQMDCRRLGFAERTFDLVVSFETIEHIIEQQQMLSEVQRVLTKQGIFIASTPETTRYNAEKKRRNPYHLKELTDTEFVDLLKLYFPYVRILWQNADSVALQFWQHTKLLGALEARIRRIEHIGQHPFQYLLRRFLPNVLKRKLRGLPGVKSNTPEPVLQTLPFVLRPEHFSFSPEATPQAKYMVAICSYGPTTADTVSGDNANAGS